MCACICTPYPLHYNMLNEAIPALSDQPHRLHGFELQRCLELENGCQKVFLYSILNNSEKKL